MESSDAKINRNRQQKDIYKKKSCKANRLKKIEWLQRNGNVWKRPTKWPTCSQKTCKTNNCRNKTSIKEIQDDINWATKCPNWDLKLFNLYLHLHKFKESLKIKVKNWQNDKREAKQQNILGMNGLNMTINMIIGWVLIQNERKMFTWFCRRRKNGPFCAFWFWPDTTQCSWSYASSVKRHKHYLVL